MSSLFTPVQEGDEKFYPIGYITRQGLEVEGYSVADLSDDEIGELAQSFGNALQGSSSADDVKYAIFGEYAEDEGEE